jgi:threonylcarbamoyladenosine tRNA methylthiotransferase MtaB
MPPEALVKQAGEIASQGYREIVLTGVNVGDYGRKIGTDLFTLMRMLERIPGIDRIRISSIEPNLLTRPMIDFVSKSATFCNHFHIPLQSGSDTVLGRMRRRYVSSHYRPLIEYIRDRNPQAGIGADVIVGFPGETDAEFEETFGFLESLPLSYLHVFTYSERPDTPAAGLPSPVEHAIRSHRSEVLRKLSRSKREAFHAAHIGRTVEVLFESESRPGYRSGWTTNYVRVESPSASVSENEIRGVTIRDADQDVCNADISAGLPGNTRPTVYQPHLTDHV